MTFPFEQAKDLVDREIVRQTTIWGAHRNHPDFYWFGILSEEVGEVAKALIDDDREALKNEVIQVAAVAITHLECILRDEPREYKPGFAALQETDDDRRDQESKGPRPPSLFPRSPYWEPEPE